MDQINSILDQYSLLNLALAGVCILLIMTAVLFYFIRRIRFRRDLKELMAEPDLRTESFKKRYAMKRLVRRAGLLAEYSHNADINLPALLGVTDVWIEKCRERNSAHLTERILEFAPERGLFFLFKRALNDKKTAQRLNRYLENEGDLLKLRKVALAGAGAPFDGLKALELFKDRIDEIREMTGDPEWAVRFFAINILLYDGDDRSLRAVWESFNDPHGLIRRTVINGVPCDLKAFDSSSDDQGGVFPILYDLLLNDPVLEVRKEARERIEKDFPSSYSPELSKLNNEQVLHVIQLLSPQSKEDQNLALGVLSGDDKELSQSAARYLQDCGVLDRIFKESYLNDKTELERNYSLLLHALNVNVTGFLDDLKQATEMGSLLLASRLLVKAGPRTSITSLARKVFSQNEGDKLDSEKIEIYQNTLNCIQTRGNDQSYGLLADEMKHISKNNLLLKEVLSSLPQRGADFFMPTLEGFLKDPSFIQYDELRNAFLQMDRIFVFDLVMDILKKGRDVYSHMVRIQALKILGELKSESCLQIILENMSILPLEEAREFANLLCSYSEKLFNERVKSILDSSDANSRASIIVSLPATGKKTFLKEIRVALDDADPEVRIASVWALVEYKETKELARCVNMLRDPMERVRVEVAKALGMSGTAAVLKDLEALLNDENEVDSVKKGVINGLSESKSGSAVDILARKIATDDSLKLFCIRALSRMIDKKSMTAAVEQFKDGGPQLREDISKAFKIMGYRGEQVMAELLKEDIPSLHNYIAQVLEETGFVESHIRKLKHRDPKIRREAALFLSVIRSRAAFRGIVLAARDPNRDVRVEVIKALESLSSGEGKEILMELENDPDKKVRQYTLWAMERIRSKSLN